MEVLEEGEVVGLADPDVGDVEAGAVVSDGDDGLEAALFAPGGIGVEPGAADEFRAGEGGPGGKPFVFEEVAFDDGLAEHFALVASGSVLDAEIGEFGRGILFGPDGGSRGILDREGEKCP